MYSTLRIDPIRFDGLERSGRFVIMSFQSLSRLSYVNTPSGRIWLQEGDSYSGPVTWSEMARIRIRLLHAQ